MKRLMFGLTIIVATGFWSSQIGLRADEPGKNKPKPNPARELDALQKEWEDARRAFATSLQEAGQAGILVRLVVAHLPKVQEDVVDEGAQLHKETPTK